MKELDVRILQLEPLRVASAIGYGPSPEHIALSKLSEWVKAHQLLVKVEKPRFFGFNNPNPSPGTPNYGYEIWVTVDRDAQPDGDISIKDFEGGLYAVTRCKGVENIFTTWQDLVAWRETSQYIMASHHWLEEHLRGIDVPDDEVELDLYMPIK